MLQRPPHGIQKYYKDSRSFRPALINACPKLYVINRVYKVVLYTEASDYAHEASLCQNAHTGEAEETRNEPIRFLSDSFSGAQVRWSTIEKEAYAIYWALGKLDDILGEIAFTIRTGISYT